MADQQEVEVAAVVEKIIDETVGGASRLTREILRLAVWRGAKLGLTWAGEVIGAKVQAASEEK